jgi:hypothetical protein
MRLYDRELASCSLKNTSENFSSVNTGTLVTACPAASHLAYSRSIADRHALTLPGTVTMQAKHFARVASASLSYCAGDGRSFFSLTSAMKLHELTPPMMSPIPFLLADMTLQHHALSCESMYFISCCCRVILAYRFSTICGGMTCSCDFSS